MRFGEMLRMVREEKGLSRMAIEKASGVKFAAIRTYEDSQRAPSFHNVGRLAAALGLTCRDFAGCEDVGAAGGGEPPAARPMGERK